MDETQQQLPGGPSAAARQWAVFCHLAGLAGFLFPFGNLIGVLVLWLIKKDEDPFIDDQGKEALNFQINVAIAALICLILSMIVIGFLLLLALMVAWIVLMVIAATKANEGLAYRYPYILRLVK